MSDTRITVPLSMPEWEALREAAKHECRNPRDHARYLLRQVLLGEHEDADREETSQRERAAA